MEKIALDSITIVRCEGPIKLCGIPYIFKTWESANNWLMSQAYTFPKDGGYDKHDFKIIFADGETYEGRLDCKALNCKNNDLDIKAHVLHTCIWHAGLESNPWCGVEKYNQWLQQEQQDFPSQAEEYKKFIELYL